MFPGRWLVRNRFDNLHKITACRCPVFIAHGTADTLVPFGHGERLFAAAAEPKRFHAMPGLGHNDAPDGAFYDEACRFLEETGPKKQARWAGLPRRQRSSVRRMIRPIQLIPRSPPSRPMRKPIRVNAANTAGNSAARPTTRHSRGTGRDL